LDKKRLVDALLDRLRHRCISINIDGPSLRSPEVHASALPGESVLLAQCGSIAVVAQQKIRVWEHTHDAHRPQGERRGRGGPCT
jgi:hypothetical protein